MPIQDGQRAGQAAAEVSLILMLLFIVGGDPSPAINEPHYLCRLKHFWDPQFAAGDLFLESRDAHFAVVWSLGWLTQFLSLTQTAWLLRLGAWTLLAVAWQRLATTVLPRPWWSVFSAGLLLAGIQEGNLAGEWVIGGFEAKCLAYGFVWLALTAWLRERWFWMALWLGIASAFHVLVGGWAVVILAAIELLPRAPEKSESGAAGRWSWLEGVRRRRPGVVAGLAIGGLIALAGVVPALRLQGAADPETIAQANQIYVFDRLPHHLAPLSKPLPWIAERAGRHGVVWALLGITTLLLRRPGGLSPHTTSRLAQMRAFAYGAGLLALAGFAIEMAFADYPARAASLLRYYWFRWIDVAAPMAVGLQAAALAADRIARRQYAGVGWLAAGIAATAIPLGMTTFHRYSDPCPPADRKAPDAAAWVELCQWVRNETAPDALFLLPQWSQSFKWRTGRAEVVTYKDIPQDAAGIVAWSQRRDQVGAVETALRKGRSELAKQRLLEVAAKYGADYCITTRGRALPLAPHHVVGPYLVYDLRRESPPATGTD
ncbi:hypothetical protein Pla175_35650 [Pirellulimonas nuda]|uniref:DUF6798 domain-containing protein n=1 Tax=Pirellulimonas nuda TaxID=2528009 RepID=A0A518DFA3_9BACT|nr:DUF6798 domain-containing protein [Pirellulimonas nuda]QDU90164.1 hypothetical protein Pla175_35650 [Pirellulimonas nuda]